MEDSRKRNLVNVSHNIMSPSSSKALSEQKGATRPPSHPGPMRAPQPKAGGPPLPPKPDQGVKRTSSYVNKQTSSANAVMRVPGNQSSTGKNVQLKQQNVIYA